MRHERGISQFGETMIDLNVMTFNLRGCVFNDGDNIWANRAEHAVRVIRDRRPDIIGFQEAQSGNLETLSGALPAYEREDGPRYNNRDPFAWNAVFWNPEKLGLRRSGGFWLSRTPDVFSGDWGTDCIRAGHWMAFETRPAGSSLFFLNTHLDHVSEEARYEGARVIAEQLRYLVADGAAVIVTGDFNCNPGSPPYEVFREEGFRDTYLEAGNSDDADDAFTFHNFTGRRDGNDGRIDWILVRGDVGASANEIVRDAKPPVYPSDHYPVSAQLRIEAV